ncbi:MAG: N-acetylmuramoyl-L-alanine amidase [Capsulimonadaceae bacterium]|nr:N-acetylmuramoyl-L-alanine amidase [Capsulimonadaceae bacterium]
MNSFKMLIGVVLLALAISSPLHAAPVVCVDPGHPSEISAGASAGRLTERHLAWVVALKLKAILSSRGVSVVMTKTRERELVTNRHRAEIANAAGAAAMIRLHCDAGAGRGFTWYYPDHAATKDGVTGPPPDVCEHSRLLAATMRETMTPLLAGHLASNPVKTDAATHVGAGQGGVLTGSIFARVPTALIEMCFLNQRGDAAYLASEAGQNEMASALAAGVMAYLARTPRSEDLNGPR